MCVSHRGHCNIDSGQGLGQSYARVKTFECDSNEMLAGKPILRLAAFQNWPSLLVMKLGFCRAGGSIQKLGELINFSLEYHDFPPHTHLYEYSKRIGNLYGNRFYSE